jgi:hypothetical protein
MSWFFRDPRLIVAAVVVVLALDTPALIRGAPVWLELLVAVGTVVALLRALALWRSR